MTSSLDLNHGYHDRSLRMNFDLLLLNFSKTCYWYRILVYFFYGKLLIFMDYRFVRYCVSLLSQNDVILLYLRC